MIKTYLEAGINHFGKVTEANTILNFFLNSKIKNLTFMLQTSEFYKKQKSLGLDFKLSTKFYETAIKKVHKKKKKVGLAICRLDTFKELSHLNFDFYKLLSAGINQKDLINNLKKKNKPIFISTGFKINDNQIKKCIKAIGSKKKLTLLHAPMTYDIKKLNFRRIINLKKKFYLPVGYSNHNNNKQTLNLLTLFKPSALFIYCKPTKKKGRVYPDNDHAFYLDEINDIIKELNLYSSSIFKSEKINKVNIFANEFKF